MRSVKLESYYAQTQYNDALNGKPCNATEYKKLHFSERKSQLAMTIEYLQLYGSITVVESARAFNCSNNKSLQAYVSALRNQGYYIVARRNITNKSDTIYLLGTEEQRNIDEHNTYTRSNNSRLYGVWSSMKERCKNKNDPAYKRYGGRGITVCYEWDVDFASFAEWAYKSGYDDNAKRSECTLDRLDRIDVNGDYEPKNCRWVSFKIQNNNRRDNVLIEHNGEVHTMAEWSDIVGIGIRTLSYRLKHGFTANDALTLPVNSYKDGRRRVRMMTINGETKPLTEWSKITGVPMQTIHNRLNRGCSDEEAVSKGRVCKK